MPTDIIVVGAGIVGCAVAYELARRGASVQVIDERGAGLGATQASAGILAPYIEAGEDGPLLDLGVRSLGLYEAFVADVRAAAGMDVGSRRTGTIEVALEPAALRRLEQAAASLRRRGVAVEPLDAAGVSREEPALVSGALGGLLVPDHGYVAATELTRALIAAARRFGAQVIEGHRVRGIRSAGTDVSVETDRGALTANAAVLAAGSWAGQVAIEGSGTSLPVRPVRGQLLHLQWEGPPLHRVTWGDRCYLVPWSDRTLLVGATVEEVGFDERTTVAGVHALIEAACELIPDIRTATFRVAKVGFRPAVADLLPVIGRSAALPSLIFATGHYRSGVLLAPLTAQLVADLLLENVEHPLLQHTRPSRFGPF